jgi:transcriptional regulator with PAS, ATPase and Fis domain
MPPVPTTPAGFNRHSRAAGALHDGAEPFIGLSAAMRAVEAEIEYAARSDVKVLITGESGVGKEIIARLIHQRSRRASTPLVAVNCAGIPDSLLESALFGHEKGSFTGAHRDRQGLLEMSNGGTIFLDEIGEMSLRMQALLLRFLENGELQRLGSDRMQQRVDVRVLAATNRPLMDRIRAGGFREDLYYRLNVVHIAIPPLRERREDVPGLLQYFLDTYAAQHGIHRPEVASETLEQLVRYDWPGNVRELKNVAERLIVRDGHGVLQPDDLPIEIQQRTHGDCGAPIQACDSRGATPRADALYERLVRGGEGFWQAVHPPFMSRDLTRDDVRALLGRGLEQTRGSYKLLVELFNMPSSDYKRFLNFLRKHECHVEFQRYRTVGRERDAAAGEAHRAE